MGGDICLARQYRTTVPFSSAPDFANSNKLHGPGPGRGRTAFHLAGRADQNVAAVHFMDSREKIRAPI